MALTNIDGEKFAQMLSEGAANLSNNSQKIDALNVFPVPDGDTGTNMNLTMTSGVKEVQGSKPVHAGKVASLFAKGLLMGARGNSGVILSQLFRGFSKEVEKKDSLQVRDIAQALQNGVETAYKAVMKPVEGTILTVAKDAASAAAKEAEQETDCVKFMETVLKEANASLERTPDLLPVLKEVGVVDSGGQGLVTIYEGFAAVLKGEKIAEHSDMQTPSLEELVKFEHHQSAQSHMATEDIEFGYCTEVMVKFEKEKLEHSPYNEEEFRNNLNSFGDSLLVVSDEDLLKIHIHAEHPGNIINEAQKFGSLVNIKVENMREQHSTLLEDEKEHQASSSPESGFAVITVGMGSGIAELFKGLGVKKVIEGGQTMNPSTEDFVKAINEVNAEKIILLPNNSNIIMAAEQAGKVAEAEVRVVPSKSVPQGLAAMLAFNEEQSLKDNADGMKDALQFVKTGEVTYAVRDTSFNGVSIKKGDFMGISEKNIVSNGEDVQRVAEGLIDHLVDDGSEIVTIIYGEERTEEQAMEISNYIEGKFTEVEVEVHVGNQPLYSYILSVE
ncbi:DAK2 domain-containing protein [Alkalicoccus halolimnae]|uniref:DAK2 domain-containing protein n=1 Tax=Alkalicoccus halolimnae TaxID=1667239 RepID=A0A5C7FD15_9BACI|nr:DAK2 domain-containing protein [Alkalicoccus halolimnae]TXF87380.1 DAK2 domain-containing protein [Alkalicoccus halolimnae]